MSKAGQKLISAAQQAATAMRTIPLDDLWCPKCRRAHLSVSLSPDGDKIKCASCGETAVAR